MNRGGEMATTNESRKISFLKEQGRDFTTVLRERVSLFFKTGQISSRANRLMYAKSIFYLIVAALGYLLILSGSGGATGFFFSFILLGLVMSAGTMNIAHDALHGAYAATSFGNRMLGFLMDVFGASSYFWKKEHTIDHHSFTNISGHDADLCVPFVLRLCPEAPRYWFHRFQHIYAPFLYCLNLIRWMYYSDPKRIWHIVLYKNKAGNPPRTEIMMMIILKLIHLFLFLVVPVMALPFTWPVIVLGYLAMLAASGLALTVTFQLAHIVEDVAFPLPDGDGKMDHSFLKHQLATTSNFATCSKLVCFLVGGLNFQIEHHIFPHICHIHLYKLSPIVRATAREFGLPYHENPTFFSAISSHFSTLKKLGRR